MGISCFDVNRTVEMVITQDGGVHAGKVVKVDFGAPRFDPMKDEFDDDYVSVMLPDGRIGGLNQKYLFYPVFPVNGLDA
jgi:hypothetical protein